MKLSLPIFVFLTFFAWLTALVAEPPRKIPDALYKAYTTEGTIPVLYEYYNNSYPSNKPLSYTRRQIQKMMWQVKQRQQGRYGSTDTYLYQALDDYRSEIKNKEVAIMGSVVPWYESVVMAYGGHPTTIEYNRIITSEPALKILTVQEYDAKPITFDAMLSISSFEHDGLGRYGEPLNADGDLQAMQKARHMLKKGGLLFLAVPIGRDCLVWNAHRIYGETRLKMLLKGWRILGYYGFDYSLFNQPLGSYIQPIIVLTPLALE